MAAPKGNKNAQKGQHGRRLVGFSGQLLDDLYRVIELGPNTDIAEYVRSTVREQVRQDLGRANNGPLCSQCFLLGEIYCQICQPAAWYCIWHYEKKHLHEE